LQGCGPYSDFHMPTGQITNGPDSQPEREQEDQQRMQWDSDQSAF
jgi:hypothetical protein